jgi:hypothetical protein
MKQEFPHESSEPTRYELLVQKAKQHPDTISDDDVLRLLLLNEAGAAGDFRKTMTALQKLGKTFDLKFSLDDPDIGTDPESKRNRLRQMKALLESPTFKGVIKSVTVIGKPEDVWIEPNVFSSGVKLVPPEEGFGA